MTTKKPKKTKVPIYLGAAHLQLIRALIELPTFRGMGGARVLVELDDLTREALHQLGEPLSPAPPPTVPPVAPPPPDEEPKT